MIPKECKRLAEVDFPVARVSVFARAEKDSRIAHIPRLHVWPAARPGGACRAVLLASLLPDPCDPACPREFVSKAGAIVARFQQVNSKPEDLRKALLQFIGDFSNWDNAHSPVYCDAARQLVAAAHCESPIVVDPFAGGGAIPLEALRMGCDAVASDLNPVACSINQVVLKDLPRYAERVLDELPAVAERVRARIMHRLQDLYPRDPDGAMPVAYLWSRTVRCEQPGCGCEIPLRPSFWLSERASRLRAMKYRVIRHVGAPPRLEFDVFAPRSRDEVPRPTVSRAKAICPACQKPTLPDRVRIQLQSQRGGTEVVFDPAKPATRAGGAMLLAVAVLRDGQNERHYRNATQRDYEIVARAQRRRRELETEAIGGVPRIPTEPFPEMSGTFNAPLYGMSRWCDMFTSRQLVAIDAMCEAVRELVPSYLRVLIALLIGKVIDLNNSLTVWHTKGERPAHMLSRWAIPMKWDFPEAVPITEASGSLVPAIQRTIHFVRSFAISKSALTIEQADARDALLPDESASVWFTDPPYYNAIPYADLSDFFFVWLKRSLPGHPLLVDRKDPSNPLTPKEAELCEMAGWDPVRYGHKDATFFEEGMRRAFVRGRSVLREDGIGCVVFAHKTTEGWEALLGGLIAAGWVITASWPIATEMSSRLRARESAALATSVHLVCRPRPVDAPVGDWADVLRELPRRVGDWMERLQSEGVRGADLVFACIGPALEIFSRYSKVETAEGREVTLPEFLEKVWEVVGRTALENVLGTAEAKARNGIAGALEEDARLTALFLWTLQSTNGGTSSGAREKAAEDDEEIERSDDTSEEEEEDTGEDARATKRPKGLTLIFDVVRRFAQPLGIHLPDWEGRIIETRKGVVRLLPVRERAEQLFGESGASLAADRIEAQAKRGPQATFDFMAPESAVPTIKGRRKRKPAASDVSEDSLRAHRGATTLDRVHAAMLLQASGRANALRALLKSEIERGSDFLRLANALSALYPAVSDEKRLLDAMLLAVPR